MRLFFHDTATSEIYTLSLHDALPIFVRDDRDRQWPVDPEFRFIPTESLSGTGLIRSAHLVEDLGVVGEGDRKSTRLNSSRPSISYAVFCLKKKNYAMLFVTVHIHNDP